METMATDAEPSIDLSGPGEEAFKALKRAICAICRKRNITSEDDVRLQKIVSKYSDRYPSLTPHLIAEEVRGVDDDYSYGSYSMLTNSLKSMIRIGVPSLEEEEDTPNARNKSETENESSETTAAAPAITPPGRCFTSKKTCFENNGYNLVTYTFFLTFIMIIAFLTSVVLTYVNYNHDPCRDWALAGGVTSTSAKFRVRGPSSDDGKAREFVVSTNPNLAIEKDQILNEPVSFGDFVPEEDHFMRNLELTNLEPLTVYYYGITRPKRTPNSAVMAGNVGTFTTPITEGRRMDFTIATGSCALTGSKSDVFTNILDLDPLLFIHTGDFHYEDLNTLDIDVRLEAYDKVMGSPTQSLLYMRTIFSYIWDDHDWLGNNQDSDYEEAAAIAKQSYTLGIPHYDLGSTSANEANAAKYQAYTIGTVRFIITDLRSESIRSSEYFSGRVYSKEQKEWFFNELSQARNYDFVVWVSTRPWTDQVEVGSDSWGGFVYDRDELSRHIASTIGAGPRNLFVISGDNHMVAFDDGSSTDYSGQDYYPGGFPLLHSGPMTNYGAGVDGFFQPSTNYFTDGCMATNSELNYQFSTIDFYFPTQDDDWSEDACLRIRSYSKDSSNVIFEKEMCGELMRYGTIEQDTCTLKKLTVPTQSMFIAAAGLIVLTGVLALWFLGLSGCHIALSFFGLGVFYCFLTVGAAVAGAFCFGSLGVNMFAVSVFILVQSFLGSLFVGKAIFGYSSWRDCNSEKNESNGSPGNSSSPTLGETAESKGSPGNSAAPTLGEIEIVMNEPKGSPGNLDAPALGETAIVKFSDDAYLAGILCESANVPFSDVEEKVSLASAAALSSAKIAPAVLSEKAISGKHVGSGSPSPASTTPRSSYSQF